MGAKEEIGDKDIKNYKLPSRKRTIVIPVEEGGKYEFDFCRPSLGQRDAFIARWNLRPNQKPLYEEDPKKFLEFARDSIRLSIPSGRKLDAGDKCIETYNFADPNSSDFDKLDSILYDILMVEAQAGVNMSARDEYFRYSGGASVKTAPANADVPSVQEPRGNAQPA